MKRKVRKPGRLKSALASFFGISYDQWAVVLGKDSESGVSVTPESSLKLSAFYACVRLIAQTVATLPVGIYLHGPDRSEDRRHELSDLLALKPNREQSAAMFWEAMVSSMLIAGNGWALKKRLPSGRLVGLEFLAPSRMSWRRDQGEFIFTYTDLDGIVREYQWDEIFHLPGFTIDGIFGVSAIEFGVEVIGAAISGNSAANRTFKNGLMPTTVFEIDRILNPTQRAEFRESLDGIRGAMNAGKAAVLEGGMKASTLSVSPSDAQLLESRVHSAEEVCRWFGVPPVMVGLGDKASSWASSSEALNLWFLQYTILPLLIKIQQSCNSQLLSARDRATRYVEFSVKGLLRGDSAGRTALYSSALQNGWMSRNEVRQLENLPPIDGGDIITVQANLIELQSINEHGSEAEKLLGALSRWGQGEKGEN